MPLERRTRATLRNAEFGFLGVVVRTWVQTPRFCGLPSFIRRVRPVNVFCVKRSAGAFSFFATSLRPLRTSWLMVGKRPSNFT